MTRLFLIAAFLLLVAGCDDCRIPGAEQEDRGPHTISSGVSGQVVRVVDGDTLHVELEDGRKLKVRVKGIDCPESRPNSKCRAQGRKGGAGCEEQIPRGKAATAVARRLIYRTPVILEDPDGGPLETDRYGRHLAYVKMADGRDFGHIMVRDTSCADYGHAYPHPRSENYREASGGSGR